MSEARTKEQIKRDVKVLLLEDSYIKQLVQDYRDTLEPDIDNLAKARAKMFKDMFTELKQRSPEHYAEYKTDLMESNSTKTEYWQKFYKAKLVICNGIIKGFISGEKLEDKEEYVKAVDFVTSSEAPDFYQESEELKKARNTADTIIKYNDGAINFYDELLEILLVRYLQTAAGIDSDTAVKLLQTSKEILSNGRETALITEEAADVIKLEIKNLLDDTPEELKPYVYALKDIKNNVYILYDAQEELNTKQAEDIENGKELKLKNGIFVTEEKEADYKLVPFKLPYAEYLTTAETEMLSIITTKKFFLDHNAVKYSEEVINSLEKKDQEILDYITLTLYRNNYYYFTDRHIAVVMYKKTPTATVSDALLEEINASLTRIQNIDLPVGYISEEINKKGKRANVKRDSKLIWLDVVKYDYDTKSTVYRIVDRPPYFDYALQTGRINKYKREIITRDIKGIQHDTKNTTLKQRFIRNIQALNQVSSVTMPITEVYNILAITDAHKYPAARKKAKEMLEDLKGNDFNFMYEFGRKNGKVAGIKLTRFTDRPLEKEKNEA